MQSNSLKPPRLCLKFVVLFFKPKEHEPAHIHAIYGEYVGLFDIQTFDMFEGDMPQRAQQLIKEWLTQHKDQLKDMWETQIITKLPPL